MSVITRNNIPNRQWHEFADAFGTVHNDQPRVNRAIGLLGWATATALPTLIMFSSLGMSFGHPYLLAIWP